MALTISMTGDTSNIIGNRRSIRGTLAFDSSYPTGGESLTAANIALRVIDQITIAPTSGYVFEYDYTNSKVLAYLSPAIAAAPSTAVALSQVANTTDLSAVTGVRFDAVGV